MINRIELIKQAVFKVQDNSFRNKAKKSADQARKTMLRNRIAVERKLDKNIRQKMFEEAESVLVHEMDYQFPSYRN